MKQINCQVDTCDYANFQMIYPNTLSRFVRNAIRMATLDRAFWNTIYFYDFDSRSVKK